MITSQYESGEQYGKLYVVSTPIGNLSDISHRAIETLKLVDLIACEDTRHTLKLCRYFNITKPLTSYFREKEHQKAEKLIQFLMKGKSLALVSDAGTPAISDPGAILVKKARETGIQIVAIAGPSALTTALSVSGLVDTHFFFGGFVPANKREREQLLRSIAPYPFSLVFYESPHRIHKTLDDMERILGDRPALLFRELTKIHEECIKGLLSVLKTRCTNGIRGELVLIIEGTSSNSKRNQQNEQPDNIEELICWYRDIKQATLKDAVRDIAQDLDLPRSSVYKLALSLWHDVVK